MIRLVILALACLVVAGAVELPSRKYLNLAAVKKMVAAAEAEALKRNVQVSICVMDDGGNLLFLQKGDGAGVNTVLIAQKKARFAALYRRPSRVAADALKSGSLEQMILPEGFPNRGGLPVQIDGQTIGSIAASGAPSEIDEAIAQAGIDALLAQ